jgi:hypothetical protein
LTLPAQEATEDMSGVDDAGGQVGQAVNPPTEQATPSSEMTYDVVVVSAPRVISGRRMVLEERREDAAVSNILASEQIVKAGDSDVASALKRVTGLTLVGGRFIYVRGLGERYSSTLLNGASVPSPDPARRVVPLDLFPVGIIETIAVQKSYTPNLPAEFGGGAVQLITRSVPKRNFIQAEVKLGYRDGTTGKDGLRYAGGDHDWTGFDDGLAMYLTCWQPLRQTERRSRNTIALPKRATLRKSSSSSANLCRSITASTRTI